MALRMQCSFEGPFSGSGGQTVRDAQVGAYWVDSAVTRIKARANLTPQESEQLSECARIMCDRMLDEADTVTSRGQQWSASVGYISVTLTPAG
ncbi:hypothetical protein ACFVW5_26385 [Streptomyces sp. NPDC058232]|uniref:hypothetical protein n=1 Tax=Streptomyces sp. NPDC058232 TaxID=3346393 RepID=UPI0036EE0FCA